MEWGLTKGKVKLLRCSMKNLVKQTKLQILRDYGPEIKAFDQEAEYLATIPP